MSLDLLNVGVTGPLSGPAAAVHSGAGGPGPQAAVFQQLMDEQSAEADAVGSDIDDEQVTDGSDEQASESASSQTPTTLSSAAANAGRTAHKIAPSAKYVSVDPTQLVSFVVTLLPAAGQSEASADAGEGMAPDSTSGTSDQKGKSKTEDAAAAEDDRTPAVVVASTAAPTTPAVPIETPPQAGGASAPVFLTEEAAPSTTAARDEPSERGVSDAGSGRSGRAAATLADGERTVAASAATAIERAVPPPNSVVATADITVPVAVSMSGNNQVAASTRSSLVVQDSSTPPSIRSSPATAACVTNASAAESTETPVVSQEESVPALVAHPVAPSDSPVAVRAGASAPAAHVPAAGVFESSRDTTPSAEVVPDGAAAPDPAAVLPRAATSGQSPVATHLNAGNAQVVRPASDAIQVPAPIDPRLPEFGGQTALTVAQLATAAAFGATPQPDGTAVLPAVDDAVVSAALLQAHRQAHATTMLVDALAQVRLPAMPLVAPAAAVTEFTRNAGYGSTPRATNSDGEAVVRPTFRAATSSSVVDDGQAAGPSAPAPPVSAATTGPAESTSPLLAPRIPNEDGNTSSLVQAIRMQWTTGTGRAVVNLDPAYLGEVRIALHVSQGTVTATVHAANADVRGWLQTNEPALRQGLAAQGLTLDRLVVLDETATEDREQPDGRRRQQEPDAETRRAPRRASAGTFNVVV